MRCQSPLRFEACKDPKRMDALRNATTKGQIALVEAEHLHPLDQTSVTGGACGADRVVGPRHPEVESHFSGRVIGHRARIVVVRPELGVIVVTLNVIDLVFGFDVSMFGDADVDSHPRLIDA